FRDLGWSELAREFLKKAVDEYPADFGLPDDRILWFFDSIFQESASVALGDLNGDGQIEVVYGNKEWLFAFYGKTGEVIWKFENKAGIASELVLGDLDGDKQDDVVFLTNEDIIALRGKDGVILWKVPRKVSPKEFPSLRGYLVLGNFGGKTLDVTVIDKNNKLYCFNGKNGKKRWCYSYCDTYNPLAVGDVNLDGIDDLVLKGHIDELVLLNGKTGRPFWKFCQYQDGHGHYYNHTVICPFNQDRFPDIITAAGTKFVILDGKNGKKLYAWDCLKEITDITVMDIYGKEDYDILITSGGRTKVFLDMLRANESTNLHIYRHHVIFRDYNVKNKSWAIVNKSFSELSIHTVYPNLISGSPRIFILSARVKQHFKDKFQRDLFSTGNMYIVPSPVVGDIDGDNKLEVVVGMGRILYALNTDIPCPKNILTLPMAGLNCRHNKFIEKNKVDRGAWRKGDKVKKN
ncbi:MAG: PQQ-binding-like beta-propeller repeat protein, partial [Candidatus Aminicenantes bacterium]|nr:PQQ-binding-like beta-propeller repeat protein [Candidatus Aminicenantes bacterium]